VHEASLHKNNSFITLTFNNENLPKNHSISKKDLQKFFKRLRKKMSPETMRYYACGEYGERNNRPHYHAIIFGYDFPDKQLYTVNDGIALYRSKTLESCWKYGFSTIGEVTFESCAYVARYVMKKRKGDDDTEDKNGKTNKQHYELLDEKTGEIHQLEPEFCLMSRKPGIGSDWLLKYKSDTDKDFITLRGVKMKLPKFYDMMLEKIESKEEHIKRKNRRKMSIHVNKEEHTDERLRVKEKVKKAQLNQLKRGYETI
jgi:hypothetical protein